MRKVFIAMLAAWWAALQAVAIQAVTDKMSAYVREAAAMSKTKKKAAPGEGQMLMTAFVSIDTTAADSILAANGCRVYDRSEDIYIVTVPVGRLESLASAACVRRIEASRPCRASMDTTATLVGATPVYDGLWLPQAYTGDGVVVGVMDIGFDVTHPTFYDSTATKYRISAFWDQLDPETDTSRFPVGREYRGTDAIIGKSHSTDGLQQTHGTHTAGIAAGSGYDSQYRGMAYESDLCLVSNAVSNDLNLIAPDDTYKYTSATDALGFKYIFDYAATRGMPCVASFSEGSVPEYNRSDSLYSRYLERLTGPGRIIVASAGNESVYLNYVDKPAGRPEAGSCLYSQENQAGFFVEANGPFCLNFISCGSPANDTTTVGSWQCGPDSATVVSIRLGNGSHGCTATIERYAAATATRDSIYHVAIECDTPLSSAGVLAVTVSGAATDASLRCYSPSMFINGMVEGAPADAETSHNIHAPACFGAVVAVGATIHRTGFTNYQGQYFDYSQPSRNDGVRSYYSSVGPTMDGLTKPDAMAPGDNIVSAYSSYYEESNPEASDIRSDVARFGFNGRTYAWNSNTGTSMATPVVAGAIALWLQACPRLTPADVKDVLSHTCRRPEDGLDYPNNQYGHGEIDTHHGLLYLLGIDDMEGLATNSPARLRAAISPEGMLKLCLDKAPAKRISLRLFAINGQSVMEHTLDAGPTNTFSIDVSSLPHSIYALQANSEEPGVSGSILVRR